MSVRRLIAFHSLVGQLRARMIIPRWRASMFVSYHPQAVVLPADQPLRRSSPRAPEDRQDGYDAAFDDRTVAFDLALTSAGMWMVAPPLRNLRSSLEVAVDGVQVSLRFRELDRHERVEIPRRGDVRVTLGGFEATLSEPTDWSQIFAGLRTLQTLSKNNDLAWIHDWASFYARWHGTEAVLLYDNGSTSYSGEEVLETLRSVSGIRAAVVVNWPFPYGPGGGPSGSWDSDFCQHGTLEHGR